MLTLKKVAVTGGLASGKSTVCRLLSNLGAYSVSADDIVHNLLSPDTDIGQRVIKLVGKQIIKKGRIDRSAIAEKVFNNPDLLAQLEAILHPPVTNTLNQLYEQACKDKNNTLFVAEVPLLFESPALRNISYDVTIAVVAEEKNCKDRYQQLGRSPEDYERRMKRQLSPDEKAALADFIIVNNGSVADLEAQVASIYTTIINP